MVRTDMEAGRADYYAPSLIKVSAIPRGQAVTRHIGCVGICGQGGGVTRDLASFTNVQIAALCDVVQKHEATMAKAYPGRPFYKNYREMLANEKSLDAVMVGTSDHCHAPISPGRRAEWDSAAMKATNAPRSRCVDQESVSQRL